MDGYIVGSMISANSITGEQIQANSIKTANLELSVQKKIQDATNEETVKALIKADLDGFESTLSKEFVTVENATTQIQQATEVAVKEATQSIIDNAVSESMGAVDGQLNDKLNQYTGNTLLPAIAEKAEEVLQNAEDYVVTKLESYATKQELSSSISQTREQIELSVSEKYTTKTESATIITEAIDGITVGAINRALGTGENKSFKFNGGANETWLPYKFSNDISDKEAYVSFNYTLTGTAQNGSQIEFAPSYLKKANNQTVYRPKHIFFTSNRLQDVNITDTVSFTTKDFQDISPSSTSYIRFVGNGFTGTLSVSEVQIKPGNSKTSWSPAPEDVNNDIVNAKNEAIISANNTLISTIANHYTKSETDSKISVAKDAINLGVSNRYETKANVETKVTSTLNSAKSYADTKKTEAINSAATDATSKVNAAKSELNTAIGKKANTVDVYSKAEVYTKSQTDSAIKVAKDEINLGVSSTYETKANVETKISNANTSTLNSAKSYADTKKTEAINSANSTLSTTIQNYYTKTETNSQINVAKNAVTTSVSNLKTEVMNATYTNLLANSDFLIGEPVPKGYWVNNTDCVRMSDWLLNGAKGIKINVSGQSGNTYIGVFTTWIKAIEGQRFTASAYVITSSSSGLDQGCGIEIEWYDSNENRIGISGQPFTPKTNDTWERVAVTGTAPRGTVKARVRVHVVRNGILYVTRMMLQEGTTTTAWVRGGDIDTVEERLTSAEQKITDSAIISTVSKSFYTKTETENAITSKGYATQSQVQQTANDITFKFSQSGGYNLILNGGFENGVAYWSKNNNPSITENQVWQNYHGKSIFISGTAQGSGIYQYFSTVPGKIYSYSFYAQAEHGIWFAGVENRHTQNIEVSPNNWRRYTGTFTATNNSHAFICYAHGSGRNVFLDNVIVCEGALPSEYTPHPSEIYDGITTIDKSGVKVSASDMNGYTHMTEYGLYVNKGGKDLVSVDRYGLRLFDAKIQLTHANGNKYFLLDENGIIMYNPANGTHQWGKVAAINNKFTVASNGNSSGLSLGHHVNENYVEDILCDSNGVVSVQRQINHNGVFYNNYGQMFVRQSGQGGWEITGRSDSQSIKPGGANQGAIGSNTQYINQSWIANRYNPSSLEIKHLSHYVDDLECLKLVSEVQPARYFYKEYDEDGNDITTFTTKTSQLGLIYEDVRECSGRDLLTNEEDKAINSYGMVSVLWGAVRNLNERLNKLEYENALLNDELQNYKQKEGND